MKSILLITLLAILTIGNSQSKLASLSIHITDYSKKALQGEQVLFVNQVSKKTFKGISDVHGNMKVNLPVGKYDIKLKSIGDSQDYSTFEVPKIGKNQMYGEMKMEIMISVPKFFTLNNLHFASGQATILKSSYKELAELVEYLQLKPSVRIQIAGHTDSDGDDSLNMELSQKRANAVRDYLIKKGIKASRLYAKGYGETKPIADNSTSKGKAQNRRTEIKIL